MFPAVFAIFSFRERRDPLADDRDLNLRLGDS
jgi:hypothetical protein